ncbi:hypothetical protein [Nocardioides sp. LML1-1-1.1]|uniref:hypothetical protein n=1 Tax=Nocardioides sp. LML1-1-1.1 TaxID=3135248 RepID=UPI00344858F7
MRRITRLLATTALALGLVATAAVEARAGTTYTAAGGPSVRLVGSIVTITDVPAGQTIACSQYDVAGRVIDPGAVRSHGTAAADLGALTSQCVHPIVGNLTSTVDPGWTVDVTGPANGTAWPARLSGVRIRMVGVGCDLTFSGTVPGTLDTATQRFTPTPAASTLVLTAVAGGFCVPLDFQVGDQMSFGGYFTNVPPTGSTALSLS